MRVRLIFKCVVESQPGAYDDVVRRLIQNCEKVVVTEQCRTDASLLVHSENSRSVAFSVCLEICIVVYEIVRRS